MASPALPKLLLIGFAAFGAAYMLKNTAPPITLATPAAAPAPATIAPSLPPEPIAEAPTIKFGSLDRSYSVLQGSFTLTNPNKFAVKDVILKCDTSGASGTVIKTSTYVVYETVPANGKRTVKDFNFGFWPSQGKSFACSVHLQS